MNETMIEKMISTLDISREEAIQLMRDDEEVDKMKSTKEIDSDLTDEQRKSVKKARQGERKQTVYKFDTSKRERKANEPKRNLISLLEKTLSDNGYSNIDVTNIEREIIFYNGETKFKLVLSAPRK